MSEYLLKQCSLDWLTQYCLLAGEAENSSAHEAEYLGSGLVLKAWKYLELLIFLGTLKKLSSFVSKRM